MLFGGIMTGILLSLIAALLMAGFYEAGKQEGYRKGVEAGKKMFMDFKANELEYVPIGELNNYLKDFTDDEGNEIPDWYPLLIVKPDSMEAEIRTHLKGE